MKKKIIAITLLITIVGCHSAPRHKGRGRVTKRPPMKRVVR